MTKEEKNYIKAQLEQLKMALNRNKHDALKIEADLEYWTNYLRRSKKIPA